MPASIFFDRDMSWLSFNERVLLEATKPTVPLLERLKYISIFSSNLDEFYRVRMPVLLALRKIQAAKIGGRGHGSMDVDVYREANDKIQRLSVFFGGTLTQEIMPQLQEHGIHIVYNQPIPEEILQEIRDYFFDRVAGFIEIAFVKDQSDFFPGNNKLYLAVDLLARNGKQQVAIVNIPSDAISRFFISLHSGKHYVVFIDDIIKAHLPFLFPNRTICGAYSIKINRDAELDLADEFDGDIVEKIEKQLAKRDFGMATRVLYAPDIPAGVLEHIAKQYSLLSASLVPGGNYHNLSDFARLPVLDPLLAFPQFQPLRHYLAIDQTTLFAEIQRKDILVHTPYQDYDCILRFFNEAAITKEVEDIHVTLYRVANNSRIAQALISAAKNGKKVTVFVEVKASFDESNNLGWAKKMKSAGIRIIYSIPGLKVHAKLALIKLKKAGKMILLGMLSTGNLNEATAGFYTDHILLTANPSLLEETESLFLFLRKRSKPKTGREMHFRHILVAQFNLHKGFLRLIEKEIANCRRGLAAGITIKVNNLEEDLLITKLYEASKAGVKINLIVRSICRLVPGVKGMSENISVKRIVGRFLEHGRVFIFCNGGTDLVYLGSSDWMNRNMYQRIEVCFPIYDDRLKKEIKDLIKIQLDDCVSAVKLDERLNNVTLENEGNERESQRDIMEYLRTKQISGGV
jgi:polyphosphate kinase